MVADGTEQGRRGIAEPGGQQRDPQGLLHHGVGHQRRQGLGEVGGTAPLAGDAQLKADQGLAAIMQARQQDQPGTLGRIEGLLTGGLQTREHYWIADQPLGRQRDVETMSNQGPGFAGGTVTFGDGGHDAV